LGGVAVRPNQQGHAHLQQVRVLLRLHFEHAAQ